MVLTSNIAVWQGVREKVRGRRWKSERRREGDSERAGGKEGMRRNGRKRVREIGGKGE